MKILFWSDGFYPRVGGIETQAFEFICEMHKRGHQVRVVANKDFPDWKDQEIYEGIPIQRFCFNSIIEMKDLSIISKVQQYVKSLLKEFQPDIIHVNTCIGGSVFVFLLLRDLFHCPCIATVHASPLYEDTIPSVIEKLLKKLDAVCCVSKWVLQLMQNIFPGYIDKMHLVYNGLSPSNIPFSEPYFIKPSLLMLGRLSIEKGFNYGIEAFHLLKDKYQNLQMNIIGDGNERVYLEHLVKKFKLVNSIKFWGQQPKQIALLQMSRTSIVIVPSLLESFGLVILEALQLQRPVIASRIQGIPELIVDGETGLLVPIKDPYALAQSIERLLENPDQAIEMGKKGYKQVIQTYTIEQNASAYENIYHQLLEKALCK